MIIRNRYSGVEFDEVRETGTQDIKNIIRRGKLASERLSQISGFEISDFLHSISGIIDKNYSDLSRIISIETGKPIKQSRHEVERSSQAFITAAEEIKGIEGASLDGRSTKPLRDRVAFSSMVPVGLVLSIHPFTEPLYSASSRTAAAIATGNASIGKPSSNSPLSFQKLMESVLDSGLPEDAVQSVIAGRKSRAFKELMNSGSFGLVTFSGRSESARSFIGKTGSGKVLLETGSSCPAIVWDDADLDTAAESIAGSAFNFQGQAPIRTQNVIVRKDSYEYLSNRLIELAHQMRPGDPLEEDTDYGPLIDEPAAIAAEGLVSQVKEKGGYVVTGAFRDGSFFEPTILENVPPVSDLMNRQVLAPIITLHGVDSLKEAIDLSNSTGRSSQAGIFTSDLNLLMTAVDRLDCSTIAVNDAPGLPTETIPSLNPGMSKTASKSIRYLVRNMVEEKLAVLRR